MPGHWEYSHLAGEDLTCYKNLLNGEYLLHLFWEPECALAKAPIWNGLPRKVKTKLKCLKEDRTIPGWGFSIEYEWDWLTFTILVSPVSILSIAIAVILCVHYQWPIASGVTLALAPTTLLAFISTLASNVMKQKGLSK